MIRIAGGEPGRKEFPRLTISKQYRWPNCRKDIGQGTEDKATVINNVDRNASEITFNPRHGRKTVVKASGFAVSSEWSRDQIPNESSSNEAS